MCIVARPEHVAFEVDAVVDEQSIHSRTWTLWSLVWNEHLSGHDQDYPLAHHHRISGRADDAVRDGEMGVRISE